MRDLTKALAALCIAISVTAVSAQSPGRLAPGSGVVSGTIQMDGGGSMAGVRVAVIAVEDSIGANLVSLSETDAFGHFRLTDVPQGHYYVVAGRVSRFTYFPGGNDRTKATEVLVEPARTIANINFRVPADSRRPPPIQTATAMSAVEYTAYQQSSNERNIFTRIKLLLSFERNFPSSALLSRVYEDLVDLYIAKGDLTTAMTYGDKLLEKTPDNIWNLIKVSRAYGMAQTNLRIALLLADKAVSTVAKLKASGSSFRPEEFRGYTPYEWTRMLAALDESARSNRDWVKQVMAWHQDAVNAAVRSRR